MIQIVLVNLQFATKGTCMNNMIYFDMNVFAHLAQRRKNWRDIQNKIFALKAQDYIFPYSPAHMEEIANLCRFPEIKINLIYRNLVVVHTVSCDMELLPGRPSLTKIAELRRVFSESGTPISNDLITVLNSTEQEWNDGILSSVDLQTRLIKESPVICLNRVLADLPVTDFAVCNDIFYMGRKNMKSIEKNFPNIPEMEKENIEPFVELRKRLGIDTSKLNNLNGKDVFLQSGVATILQYSCAENGLSVASIPKGNELIHNHELLETYVTICMNVLDKAGYYSDKENDVLKLRSRMNDVSHAIYGAVTNYFITDDTRLAKRIFSTYSFLGIQTKILNTKEFMLI